MWHSMFHAGVPVDEKLLRTVLVYALIAVLIRVGGKRGLAQLNTHDIAVVYLLSNVVQNAIIGNDNSVTGGAIGAVTLVAVDAALNRVATLGPRAARVLDGTDTPVIQHGKLVHRAVRRLGLRPAELAHAVRMQNGDNVSEVQTAVFSANGQLVITLKPGDQSASKDDVDRLTAHLARIEALLAART
jgi:uncharacterized membrane protein YcaP (DUF421 family)